MNKWVSFMLVSILLFFSCTILAPTCYACSCAYARTPEEALNRSHTAFAGKVLDVKLTYDLSDNYGAATIAYRNLVLFEIMESYKGVAQTQIIVDAGLGEDSCGYDFIPGESYLVYASNVGKKNIELKTGLCSGTKKLAMAGNEIEQFNKLSQPLKPTNLSAQMAASPFDILNYFGKRFLHRLLQPSYFLFHSIALVILALLTLIALFTRKQLNYGKLGVYAGATAGFWNLAVFFQMAYVSSYPKVAHMYMIAILLFIFLPAISAVAASLFKSRILFIATAVWSLPGLYISSVLGIYSWFATGVLGYILAAFWLSLRSSKHN